MDEWIKLRQELNKHHLSRLGEKLLPEIILKLRREARKLNAETVAAEVEAAVIRHRAAKSAEKKKLLGYKQPGKAGRKPNRG